MKKYILIFVAIIFSALVLWGLSFIYLATKEGPKIAEKPTKESITELFSKQYSRPAKAILIEVQADTGAFAKGTVNFKDEPGGGGVWFAAKTANGWELASTGNGIVSCADINKYNFPRDIIPQCLDTQNGNELVDR